VQASSTPEETIIVDYLISDSRAPGVISTAIRIEHELSFKHSDNAISSLVRCHKWPAQIIEVTTKSNNKQG
jgi:serine/threonine protein phosphatase PrpC